MSSESAAIVSPSLPGNPALPLYQRLVCYFQEAVAAQQWRPGERLPSEKEIAGRLGVAVGTVRHALSGLVREGMLVRRQGKGTYVRRPSFDSSLFRFWRFHEHDQEARPPESRILRIRKIIPSAEVASGLLLKENEPAVFISRLRLREGNPIVAEEIWLSHRKFSALLDMPKKEIGTLLYPVYEQICGQYVARAEERLTAQAATARRARALATKPGVPLIVINRLARGFDGVPLEWRMSWGCAKLFQYRVEIH